MKQNRHGDIIGVSLDDILKANDCLSKTCSEPYEKKAEEQKPDDVIFIDLDTKCTVTVESPQQVKKQDVSLNDFVVKERAGSMTRPDWKTHKRERSDDSLPDPDNPMYNLILLSKSAVREQKRLAVEANPVSKDKTQENKQVDCEPPKKTDVEKSIIKKLVCDEVLPEKDDPVLAINSDENTAKFFLSVFHAMTGLAAIALYQLQRSIAV